MKTIEVVRSRFTDATLEASVNSKIENILIRCRLKGKELGGKGFPLINNDSMKGYFEQFEIEFQELLDQVNMKYQSQLTCFEVAERDRLDAELIDNLERKLEDAEQEFALISDEVANMQKPVGYKALLKARICMLLVAGFDTALNSQYFQMLGYSYIESIAVGTFFAGVLVIFAHFVPRIVRLAKTVFQQRLIAVGIFLFMTAVFSYLAGLRTEYANATDGTNYSPWFFVLLSMFLFVTTVFTYMFLMPTKLERVSNEQYHSLIAKQKSAMDRMAKIESELKEAKNAKSEYRLENSSIMLFGWMLEKRIISAARKALAVLKSETLRFRTDNGKPDCLDKEYPIELKRYFDQID